MHASRPVTVDGHFVGVLVSRSGGWVFLATDPLLADLEGCVFPDPEAAARVALLALRRCRGKAVLVA